MMPARDGTGPMGMGPMSGKGMGCCAGFAVPGYANAGYGHRHGFQRRAYNCFSVQNMCAEDEKTVLSRQADFFKRQLEQVQKRIDRLDDTDS